MGTVDDSHIRIGVVVYHDSVNEVIHIDQFRNNKSGLKDKISQITRSLKPSGEADLARAFDYVRENSFKRARGGVPRVVIPIIHQMGRTRLDEIPKAAARLKAQCTAIIAISVGSSSLNYDIIHQSVTQPYQNYSQAYYFYYELEFAAKYLYNINCPTSK